MQPLSETDYYIGRLSNSDTSSDGFIFDLLRNNPFVPIVTSGLSPGQCPMPLLIAGHSELAICLPLLAAHAAVLDRELVWALSLHIRGFGYP